MGLLVKIRRKLTDPRLAGVDYNSDELLKKHRRILNEKKMIRDVFIEFYDECIDADRRFLKGEGIKVEIGAGTSFFKSKYPEIISSDIKYEEFIDMVVDAQSMPFDDNTVRAFYGINCFHHLPEPEKFFTELNRCLIKGGGCILIEPYHGIIASIFYKRVFDTEYFNKHQTQWNDKHNQIMLGANQALSYIIFCRDREKFVKEYPDLEIVYTRPFKNYLRYLLSGGLNFRQICPQFLSPVVKGIELLLIPFIKIFALHYMIVIRKKL